MAYPISPPLKALLDQGITDAYFSMVGYIQNRYYKSVSRYTTNAFMRLKLITALAERELGPDVFESRNDAHSSLDAREETDVPRLT